MKEVTIGNKTFESKTEAALAYGISVQALYRRLKRGWTEEDFERGYRCHVNNWNEFLKHKEYDKKVYKMIESIMDLESEDEILILKEAVEKRLKEIKGN